MLRRARSALLLALAACEPQVVDAVDRFPATGAPMGGSAASAAGASNGSGGTSACLGASCCNPAADRDDDGVDDSAAASLPTAMRTLALRAARP
jgi:hypothetical protein